MNFLRKYSFLIKIIFCLGTLYWLTQSGKLEFSKLRIFYLKPEVLLAHFTCWLSGHVFLNSVRLQVLLRIIGVKLNLKEAFNLTSIGLFFNSFLPGSVSGDSIKAYYIIKENKKASKSALLLSILLDRALAFYALFMMASFGIFFFFPWEETLRASWLTFPIFFVALGISSFLLITYLTPLGFFEKRKIFQKKYTRRAFNLFMHYKNHPKLVLLVILLGLLTQFLGLSYFVYLTSFFNPIALNIKKFFVVYPLGLLSSIIPLAPGGMGVGHATFDSLFQYFNLKEGANIFNILTLGYLSFNLLGFFPYLLKKGEKKA